MHGACAPGTQCIVTVPMPAVLGLPSQPCVSLHYGEQPRSVGAHVMYGSVSTRTTFMAEHFLSACVKAFHALLSHRTPR